ncbi:O-methylsterigmatocystin oxidoreductase [Thelonectria olida]|uniref:O-methylsterigmatocystin oxidoreductase n=1 Tax=Thelonectria olida TaxID=1576542 RepID=A0A9P8VRL2_9HYPO|nr:O-methylsterigmatocystin oxidoreductase [Thelonectria olida]
MHLVTKIVIVLALALFIGYKRRNHVPHGYRLPPGPRGWPLIGNAHELGPYPRNQFQKWAAQYGEVFQVQIGLQRWVLFNSPEAIKDVFDKQSALTSGRPPMPVFHNQVSGNWRLVSMDYGPKWRRLRTALHQCLSPKMSDELRPGQEFESGQLLHDILTANQNEQDFYDHVRRYATSVVMTAAYGQRIPSYHSNDFVEVYQIMDELSIAAQPLGFVANDIPILYELPEWMHWWKKRAFAMRDRQTRIWSRHWATLKAQLSEGKAPPCFARSFLESAMKEGGLAEEEGLYLGGTLVEAGSGTTSATILTAIKYLMANPRVQERAFEELSTVVGSDRLPTFEDEASLLYIRSISKEVLRMRPIVTAAIPHYNHNDLFYKDFFIPRGSNIAVCGYVPHYDETRIESPNEFRPERYLKHTLKSAAYANQGDPNLRDHFSFGHGRRICSGIHVAENSIFIVLARLLWAYEIRPPFNGDGTIEAVDVSDEAFEPYMFNLEPKKYKARFIPRSEKHAQVLEQNWNISQGGYVMQGIRVDSKGMVV